jgi:nucleotide-binding universal stress UspA family protein
MRSLIPVLDSVNALPAVRHVIRESLHGERCDVQLVDVRSPLGHALKGWLTVDSLKPASELLDRFRVRHTVRRLETRDRAGAIAAAARRHGADTIVLGAARYRSATRMSEDVVIQKLLEVAPVPVLVVTGKEVSPIERYGVAAGLGATLGLILFG